MSFPVCFAIVNASEDELAASSSGGAFSIIARAALERGGVVYGHAFTSSTRVACVRADDLDGLARLRGSKYVQSDMGSAMRSVLGDLRAGREVVFSGTPCQVAALKAFLEVERARIDRLLLVDIVCHGVPSPEFFADCMGWETRGFQLDEVRFRDKREGWGCIGIIVVNGRGELKTRDRIFSPETSYYYRHFLAGDVYRESCYRCPYACGQRPGDVTIGDFWGIDPEAVHLDSRRGISLVIANTIKGQSTLQAVRDVALWVERPIEEAIDGNDQLRHPTPRPFERDSILEEWKTKGIDALEEAYIRETAWKRRVWLTKRAIGKVLRKVLRR